MDRELRRRFLQSLSFDFAKIELREHGVKLMDPTPNGSTQWPKERAWWLNDDPTPVVRVEGANAYAPY